MKKLKTLLLAMGVATLASISINAYANGGTSYIYENLQRYLTFPVRIIIQDDGANFYVQSISYDDILWRLNRNGFYLTNDGHHVSDEISTLGYNYKCHFTGIIYDTPPTQFDFIGRGLTGKCDR